MCARLGGCASNRLSGRPAVRLRAPPPPPSRRAPARHAPCPRDPYGGPAGAAGHLWPRARSLWPVASAGRQSMGRAGRANQFVLIRFLHGPINFRIHQPPARPIWAGGAHARLYLAPAPSARIQPAGLGAGRLAKAGAPRPARKRPRRRSDAHGHRADVTRTNAYLAAGPKAAASRAPASRIHADPRAKPTFCITRSRTNERPAETNSRAALPTCWRARSMMNGPRDCAISCPRRANTCCRAPEAAPGAPWGRRPGRARGARAVGALGERAASPFA